MNTNLIKIGDHLYETRFKDDFNWHIKDKSILSGFACSAVQNGIYRGRNYDWTFADTDICIIHASVSTNRPHASVGVSDLSFVLDGDGSIKYSRIPFATVDGINDAGVCIQVNVMPFGENGSLKHSKTTSDDLPGAFVVRYILDYASSIQDAIDLLSKKDIYSEMGTEEELHWMISGPTSSNDKTIKTVIVEAFPDGLHITDKFVDDKPIMTNFNISNFDGTKESVGFGMGYERWQILNEFYDQANSIMGTFDLMEKVYYSKLYDLYSNKFWYSEYNGTNISKYYDEDKLKELLGDKVYGQYINDYGKVLYSSSLWGNCSKLNGDISKTGILSPVVNNSSKKYDAQNKEDGSLWITIHTSVYDLEKLTLDIQVHESQDHLHFTID